MTDSAATSETDAPLWDLTPLYSGLGDPALEMDIQWLEKAFASFESDFKGRLGSTLGEALQRYETIDEILNKIFIYLNLRYYADLEDSEVLSRLQDVRTTLDRLNGEHLAFFPLEIGALEHEQYRRHLREDTTCQKLQPWLDHLRENHRFRLTEEVEGALAKRQSLGAGSWSEFYNQVESDLRFPFLGEEKTLTQMLHLLSESNDPGARAEAQRLVNDGLGGPFLKFSAQALNMVVRAKQVEDRERGYRHPMEARNRSNRIPEEVVETLHSSVVEIAGPLCQRYYRLKARMLGMERLRWSDRNAPLPFADTTTIPYPEALETVKAAYRSFSPTLADLLDSTVLPGRVDVPVRPGKQSGAFNYSVVLPGGRPIAYTLLNHQGSTRDVMTLAHELGHGVHGILAGEAQGALQASPPMAYAETASIFGETTTFHFLSHQLERSGSATSRLALLAGKIEDGLNSVVRQIGFSLFEQSVHNAGRHLPAEEINALWMESLTPLYGKEGDLFTYENTEHLWSYVNHFHSPFYVYAYAFGDLLTQSLYAVSGDLGDRFEPLYLDLLRAGGSQDVRQLLQPFGLNAEDPTFWEKGIRAGLETLLDEAESLFNTLESTP
ncbi:MAG: M3 family oligoendopeptidase [Magnetococcales bacterium]|nr:M3 family oligoendopeptidase [Magnetococcales bacterium]